MYQLLSHDWAGIVLALVIVLAGGCLFKISRRIHRKLFRRLLVGLGGCIFILSRILTVKYFVFGFAPNPSQFSSISTQNKIITSKTARSRAQQAKQIPRNLQTIKFQINSALESERNNP